MATCEECAFFFKVPEDADDYELNKGDCVTEKRDEKGTYWLSKPVFTATESCIHFDKK